MSKEQFYGPYLYHGSSKKFPVGDIIKTPVEINPDDATYATEDIVYAGGFGHIHKVVPTDWEEAEPFEPGNDPEELQAHPEPPHRHGDVYWNFASNKGFRVIGHSNFVTPTDLSFNPDPDSPTGGEWTSGGKRWHRPVRGSGQD